MKMIRVGDTTYVNFEYLTYLRYQEYKFEGVLCKEIVMNIMGAGRIIVSEEMAKEIDKEVKELYVDMLLLAASK